MSFLKAGQDVVSRFALFCPVFGKVFSFVVYSGKTSAIITSFLWLKKEVLIADYILSQPRRRTSPHMQVFSSPTTQSCMKPCCCMLGRGGYLSSQGTYNYRVLIITGYLSQGTYHHRVLIITGYLHCVMETYHPVICTLTFRFKFPSILVVYGMIPVGIFEIILLISFTDRKKLFCNSRNLVSVLRGTDTLTGDDVNSTPFCVFSGEWLYTGYKPYSMQSLRNRPSTLDVISACLFINLGLHLP